MDYLKGKKTYILAVVALITIAGNLLGYIDADTANVLLTVFGFGGLITLRSALK